MSDYENTELAMVTIQSISKFPQYATFFRHPGYICAVSDKISTPKVFTNFYDVLKANHESCISFLYSGAQSLVCKNKNKIGDIEFNTSGIFKFGKKNQTIKQYMISNKNCTEDGLENYTLKITYSCDRTVDWGFDNLYRASRCQYNLKMVLSRMCKYNFLKNDDFRKIYCMKEHDVPIDFQRSIFPNEDL